MPIRTWIEGGVVFREITGEATIEDIIDELRSLPDHPEFQKGMPSLWDLRKAILRTITQDDLYKIQQFNIQNAEKRGENFKIAYVVSRDLEFGLGRMSEAILRAEPPRLRHTFRSMTEAIEWIRAPIEEGREANER